MSYGAPGRPAPSSGSVSGAVEGGGGGGGGGGGAWEVFADGSEEVSEEVSGDDSGEVSGEFRESVGGAGSAAESAVGSPSGDVPSEPVGCGNSEESVAGSPVEPAADSAGTLVSRVAVPLSWPVTDVDSAADSIGPGAEPQDTSAVPTATPSTSLTSGDQVMTTS
jgi:hypothetical protein